MQRVRSQLLEIEIKKTLKLTGASGSGIWTFYQGLDIDRISRRREFVKALNEFSSSKDAGAEAVSDPELERAYSLITSPEAKGAFSLTDEPHNVRSRYGLGGVNGIGMSCLLARRLVERGVPFVTVNHTGWEYTSRYIPIERTISH